MFILFQVIKMFFVVLFLDNDKPNIHKGGYDWCTVKPLSHCTLVLENCQKIAGVPSVWTQTRPGINSGIDPGLGT